MKAMLNKLLPILLVTCAFGQNRDLPNVVLILTDDLDSELGGDEPLTKTRGWINDNGVDFSNAFVNVPVCCPSRSSLLTGLHQHNHGVVNNSISGDCSGETWRQGPERESFASYLKGAGYVSFYGGKYLNQYGFEEGGGIEHVPNGWDFWAGLVGNSRYGACTIFIAHIIN